VDFAAVVALVAAVAERDARGLHSAAQTLLLQRGKSMNPVQYRPAGG